MGTDPTIEPGRRPVERNDADAHGFRSGGQRRPEPAAMRETLDAARRRLGQSASGSEEPRSAEELRGLLRAAATTADPPTLQRGNPMNPSSTPASSPDSISSPPPH